MTSIRGGGGFNSKKYKDFETSARISFRGYGWRKKGFYTFGIRLVLLK